MLPTRAAELLAPGDELILAHVVESACLSPAAYGSEFALPQPDVPRLIEAARLRLERIDLGTAAPRLSIALTTGRPGEGLVGLVEDRQPHLVVVRTHGRRGFDRMMLGSVSEYLARRSPVAVLIFPKT